MPTSYPASLDSLARPTSATAMNATGYEGDVVIDSLSDAVEAVQAELGTDPAGSQATVKARLGYVEATASTFQGWVWRAGDYLSTQAANTNSTAATCYADSIDYVPLWVPVSGTADRVGVYIQIAGAGNIRIGLYGSTTAMVPGSLISSFGTVDVSTTGLKEITISQAVTGGTLYWVALQHSVNNWPRGTTNARPVLGNVSGAAISAVVYFQEDEVYSSGLPATATVQYVVTTSTSIPPIVFLRGS